VTPKASTKRPNTGTEFAPIRLEPAYRTMDEATASGLEICDICVALFRRQGKAD